MRAVDALQTLGLTRPDLLAWLEDQASQILDEQNRRLGRLTAPVTTPAGANRTASLLHQLAREVPGAIKELGKLARRKLEQMQLADIK